MKRHMVLMLLSGALLSCACGPVLPPSGGVIGGMNSAPLILLADVVQLPNGALRLSAAAIDPEFDAVTLSYEQVEGPFVTEQARQDTDGALVVDLAPSTEGVYAFRITASDNALQRSTVVSTTATIAAAGPAPPGSAAAAQRIPPTGTFDILITGQVIADEGLQAFALDATLTIEPPTPTRDTAVTLRTTAAAAAPTSPPGAVALASQSARGDALLAVSYAGNELSVTGPEQLGTPTPGQFRTAKSRAPRLDIAGARVMIRFSGDTVAGTVDLSSGATVGAGFGLLAEYQAQFTGTRR